MARGTLSVYMAMADAEIAVVRPSPFIGLNDPSVAGLRTFIRYHKDARQDVELAGKLRSLTHKQVAMHGLITRIAGSSERHTITSLAKEANVVPSTLSRFLDKLQVWNVYAIDVTRGRNGGIRVRLRGLGDQLAAYAERAWLRVKKAAEKAISRTRINVASLEERHTKVREDEYWKSRNQLKEQLQSMDATFSDFMAWREAHGAGSDGQMDAGSVLRKGATGAA